MGKNKLKKFAQIARYDHVFEPTFPEIDHGGFRLRGKWSEEFGNNNPIVLELACGKGEYTVGQARIFPDRNFIGIDIKGSRIYSGAKEALDEGLDNVRFLRTRIDLITAFFAENEIDEIWITFADPQLGKPRKRLTSNMFLSRYIQFLKPGGTLNLKTDSDDLYFFTREESIPEFNASQSQFAFEKQFDTDALYAVGIQQLDEHMQQVLAIRTYYERIWLTKGKSIKYLRYKLSHNN